MSIGFGDPKPIRPPPQSVPLKIALVSDLAGNARPGQPGKPWPAEFRRARSPNEYLQEMKRRGYVPRYVGTIDGRAVQLEIAGMSSFGPAEIARNCTLVGEDPNQPGEHPFKERLDDRDRWASAKTRAEGDPILLRMLEEALEAHRRATSQGAEP